MITVNIDDIKQNLLHYISKIQNGEEFLILQEDKPVAELKPVSSSIKLRPFGLCQGEFVVPDNFSQLPTAKAVWLVVPRDSDFGDSAWTTIGLLTEALRAIFIAPFKSAFISKPQDLQENLL